MKAFATLLSLALLAALLTVQPVNAQGGQQGGYERCYRESRAMGYTHDQASRYCARYPKTKK
jgi:hypothetical protein